VAKNDLTPSEWTVLALTAEAPIHGWALSVKLAKGGEIGSIWSLGRPLVYHSLERLEQAKLIKPVGLERGERGPHRVVYSATPKGRAALRSWLAQPVEHVRDVRSFFLLKVVLSQRVGVDVEPLLVAQRAVLVPFVTWLEAQLDDVDPAGLPGEATMLYFRLETAKTIVRFIDGMLDDPARRGTGSPTVKRTRRSRVSE
jgi:DNA-binding PadR family transcriptional regulator